MDESDALAMQERGARQAQRLIAGSFLVDVLFLYGHYALALVPYWAVVVLGGWAIVQILLQNALARRRMRGSLRLSTATFVQTMPIVAVLLYLTNVAPGAALQFVCGLFVAFAFSAVVLQTWQIWAAVISVTIGLALSLSLADGARVWVGPTWPERLLAALVVACGLVRCLSLGLWAQSIRARLARNNLQLADSLRKLDELATIDPLTGTLNRRCVLEAIDRESERIASGGAAICVAMLDLDFFKIINDRFGHLIGDQVLRTFAQIVSSHLREADTIGRYGGEEFLIVLRTGQRQHAMLALERIRVAVADFDWSMIAEGLQVTVSIGATQSRGGDSPDVLLGRADVALYRAKREGRDRLLLDASV